MFILFFITGSYGLKSQEVPIIRVIDGDANGVILNGKKQSVQLMNLDTLELKKAFDKGVKDSLSHLLNNKTLVITALKLDIYGNLLIPINYQDKALNSLVVAKDLGCYFEKYNTNKALNPLQIIALSKQKGLRYCHRPEPP